MSTKVPLGFVFCFLFVCFLCFVVVVCSFFSLVQLLLGMDLALKCVYSTQWHSTGENWLSFCQWVSTTDGPRGASSCPCPPPRAVAPSDLNPRRPCACCYRLCSSYVRHSHGIWKKMSRWGHLWLSESFCLPFHMGRWPLRGGLMKTSIQPWVLQGLSLCPQL